VGNRSCSPIRVLSSCYALHVAALSAGPYYSPSPIITCICISRMIWVSLPELGLGLPKAGTHVCPSAAGSLGLEACLCSSDTHGRMLWVLRIGGLVAMTVDPLGPSLSPSPTWCLLLRELSQTVLAYLWRHGSSACRSEKSSSTFVAAHVCELRPCGI
jgi:hypothetical protein